MLPRFSRSCCLNSNSFGRYPCSLSADSDWRIDATDDKWPILVMHISASITAGRMPAENVIPSVFQSLTQVRVMRAVWGYDSIIAGTETDSGPATERRGAPAECWG